MHVTSDYYRSRLHRIAACSSEKQGACHAPEYTAEGFVQARGLCRPIKPSEDTLSRLAAIYKTDHSKSA